MNRAFRVFKRIIGPAIDTAVSLVIYAVLVIAVLVIIGQAHRYYRMGYGIFSQSGKDAPGTGIKMTVEVTEGMSVSDVAKMLESNGIVENARIFTVQEKVSSYSGQIKPGRYTISSEMTTETILSILSGAVVTEEDAAAAAAAEAATIEAAAAAEAEEAEEDQGIEGTDEDEGSSGEEEEDESGD